MKRILFIPGQGFAHTTRSLRLAQICSASYDVKILLTATFEHLAKAIQIPYRVVLIPEIDYKSIIQGNYEHVANEDRIVKDVHIYEKEILDYCPDVVVTSAAMNALIPIRKHGINHIALADASTVNELLNGNNFNNPSIEHIKETLLTPFNKVAAAFNIQPVTNLLELMSPELNLIPDLSCLFPLSGAPDTFKYIGPLTWCENDIPIDSHINIDPTSPLLYVSMGSSGNSKDLEHTVTYISHSSFQVIVTTGNVIDTEKLKSLERPGLYIERFMPGNQIIKMSEKTLVICHAGLGTVYQALENNAYGLITIPAHFKHTTISQILKSLGVAKEIDLDKKESLLNTCEEILDSPQLPIFKKIKEELDFYRKNNIALSVIDEYVQSN